MPSGPHWRAADFASSRCPSTAAVYGTSRAAPDIDTVGVTTTIRPPRPRIARTRPGARTAWCASSPPRPRPSGRRRPRRRRPARTRSRASRRARRVDRAAEHAGTARTPRRRRLGSRRRRRRRRPRPPPPERRSIPAPGCPGPGDDHDAAVEHAHAVEPQPRRTGSALMPLMKFERSRRAGPALCEARHPGEQLLEHHPRLEPGEARAEAEVRTSGAERDVLVRCATDIEAVRVGELLFVAVRRRVPHGDLVALADRLARELGVGARGATEVDDRRDPAQHLLDRGGEEREVGWSRARSSGCSNSVSMPPVIRLRVVSLPAFMRSMKNRSTSIGVRRSPSTSARRSTLSRSVPSPPARSRAAGRRRRTSRPSPRGRPRSCRQLGVVDAHHPLGPREHLMTLVLGDARRARRSPAAAPRPPRR